MYLSQGRLHVIDHLVGPAVEKEGAAEHARVAERELGPQVRAAAAAAAAVAWVRGSIDCYGPPQFVLLPLQLLHLHVEYAGQRKCENAPGSS